MKSTGGTKLIIAVVFIAALLVSSGARAGSLFAHGGDLAPKAASERQIGLFDRALSWLTGAWTGLSSAFESSEEAPPPPPNGTECTQDCGDAGPGIDPLG